MHEAQLQEALSKGKPLFLLGDMNIDLSSKSSPGVRRYEQLLAELNLTQLVQKPTNLLPRPSIIDHVITNTPDFLSDVKVLTDSISDHQPVTCLLRLPKSCKKTRTRQIRRWNKTDWNAVCLDLLLLLSRLECYAPGG